MATITFLLPKIFDQPELVDTANAIRVFLTANPNDDTGIAKMRDDHEQVLQATLERYDYHLRHLEGYRPPVDGVTCTEGEARLVVSTIRSVLQEGGFAIYVHGFGYPLLRRMDFRKDPERLGQEVIALLSESLREATARSPTPPPRQSVRGFHPPSLALARRGNGSA